jgi:large subunit ribosomal protein L10
VACCCGVVGPHLETVIKLNLLESWAIACDSHVSTNCAELRLRLSAEKAEYHVVKNSSLRVAAKSLGLPDIDSALVGPTAIIVGGKNSAGVAKVLKQFFKDKQKIEVKAGVLSKKLISPKDVERLAEMPSLEVLRSQLLGLMNQPASMFVRIINAVPQGLVNVLQAKVRAAGPS